jgi:hypothetical protein
VDDLTKDAADPSKRMLVDFIITHKDGYKGKQYHMSIFELVYSRWAGTTLKIVSWFLPAVTITRNTVMLRDTADSAVPTLCILYNEIGVCGLS